MAEPVATAAARERLGCGSAGIRIGRRLRTVGLGDLLKGELLLLSQTLVAEELRVHLAERSHRGT
jgi:hypothetical protein